MGPRRVQQGSDAATGRRGPRSAPPSRWWRPQRGSATKIAGLYAALGLAWIAFSDRLVEALVRDPALREQVQTAKGTLYVLLTALLLFGLIRRSESRVRALGAEVRATVDSMADAVFIVDDRSQVVEANRAAVALLGASSKRELLGPVDEWGRRFQLRTLDGAPVPLDRYGSVRALSGERRVQYDAVVRRLDGRDVFVSVAASPVAIRSRRRPLAVAVLRDVSAARRVEEMREEFLAMAAHELKTPLAVIKAYAQLMQRREPGDPQPLLVIERQVDRLGRIVQQMLEASRLRAEPGEGRRERFDLAALAREIVEGIRPSAPSHRLEVNAGAPVEVRADRERIGHVIGCLLDNAIRFSPAGGPVRTRVEAADRLAHVAVTDVGVGIPPERQAQVFERYYRAHAGTKDDYGGIGLGLGMSREVIQRQGGKMWFESAPGAGSTFHFAIPLDEEGGAP